MSIKSVPFQMQIRKYKISEVIRPKKTISHTITPSRTRNTHLAHDYPISHTITSSRTRLPLSRTRLLPSRTRLPPSRTRFQSRSRWVFYCKWSKNDWMSMNEETARAGIRVREAEKAHSTRIFSKGRGAKKKGPDCIQIRVLLWCRRPGSNRYGVATAGF